MRVVLSCLALIAAWIVLPSNAGAASGKSDSCVSTKAKLTTIEAVRGDYKAWRGHCVALRGIAVGARLYSDRLSTLEPRQSFGEQRRHSIVIYNHRPLHFDRKPRMVEVVGIVGSCADQNDAVRSMQADNPNDIIMVSGFCHTSLETFVQPVSVSILSSKMIPRLVEAEVPEDQRELIPAPVALPGLAGQLAAARALVAALAMGDETAFRRLSRPELQAEIDRIGTTPLPDWLRRGITETHHRFAGYTTLRRRFETLYHRGMQHERVLVERLDLKASVQSADEASAVVVCWCTTKNCAGRWPISAFDADNLAGRPYLCVSTNKYVLGPRGNAIQADVTAEAEGFAEPSWPASPQ